MSLCLNIQNMCSSSVSQTYLGIKLNDFPMYFNVFMYYNWPVLTKNVTLSETETVL